MLTLTNVDAYYGRVQALHEVNLEVKVGEIVAILGSNGAGKTTLLKTVHGILPARRGAIRLGEHELSSVSAEARIRLGIAHVPEGRQLFPGLTVLENLRLGAYARARRDSREAIRKDQEAVFRMFPILESRKFQKAGTLSGGEQQMAAIGRALMSAPRLLLLDEPSLGLAPKVKQLIFREIHNLNTQRGLTVLLVEQDTRMALSICNRCYVMQTGRIVLSGSAEDLMRNDEIRRIYLGQEDVR